MRNPFSARLSALRPLAIWTLGFVSFPVAGIAGELVGKVNSPLHAFLGGLAAGLVIGLGQSLASSKRLDPRRWIPATSIGMGVGLLVGASAVDFGTSLTQLAGMGAITGAALGVAQAVALPTSPRRRVVWAAALPALWSLGWVVTTLIGVDVEAQYTNFGAAGAVTFSLLSGILLHLLLPVRTLPESNPTVAPRRFNKTGASS